MTRLNPLELAKEITALIGPTDHETAQTALEIALLLLSHRKMTQLDFEIQCIEEQKNR